MPKPSELLPPPYYVKEFDNYSWKSWFNIVHERLSNVPTRIQGYSVSDLPSAVDYGSTSLSDPFTGMVFVHDEVGGPCLAFSDGTNWKRVHSPATTIS